MKNVVKIKFVNYDDSVFELLENLKFGSKLRDIRKIIIKPNLLQDSPPPCTTDYRCVESIVKYVIKKKKKIKIVIIEGSGGCPTETSFKNLGYESLIKKYDGFADLELVDVDKCKLINMENENALAYKKIWLPEVVFGGFFITVPGLKDHLITTVTLGLKNQVGLLPEKYYGGYWSYRRSDVHRVGINKAIFDLNNYIKVDMAIIDGRIGQAYSHLPGGKKCNPPKEILIGGYDVLNVDKVGTEVLGHSWEDVEHIKLFNDSLKR
ncbi:MAG: DUF362 domain-containing protein [Actinomycetota bacterium]|nr:DUF362 domain-containing protein [Actinomycetota bacterium]